MKTELKTFIRSYLITALWSSYHTNAFCEGCNENLACQVDDVVNCPKCGSTEIVETHSNLDDADFSDHKFSLVAMRKVVKDCEAFMALEHYQLAVQENGVGQVAQDFWLTRNRHGGGFWDGDYSKHLGENLTEIAQSFGEINIFPENDSKLFIME